MPDQPAREPGLNLPRRQVDRSPTLIYQDENGEARARTEDRFDTRSTLQGALRVARQGHDRGGSARAAAAELQAFAEENGLVLHADLFRRTVTRRRVLAEGSEHTVWFDPASGHVVKLTHPDYAGDGTVGQGDLVHYLASLDGQNREFVTDIRLLGIVSLDGELPQIVISQPHIKGRPATEKEIAAFMCARGFRNVDGTWRRGSIAVDDAVGANVMAVEWRGGAVTIIPFDVQVRDTGVRQTPPGSAAGVGD